MIRLRPAGCAPWSENGKLFFHVRSRWRGIYYGWVQVLALSVTETISWGVLYYTFSVFLVPMQAELGWSQVELTGGFSLALLVSGVAALPVGRWLDRHGPRALMTLGSCLGVALVLAWAAVEDRTTFYLIWAGIGVAMAAVLYEPAFVVVTAWFRRERARALSLITFVAGFASTIFLPLADWLMRAQGWRMALVTLALLLAIGTIPLHMLALRRSPADMGLLPDGAPAASAVTGPRLPDHTISARVALRGATFWWLTAAFTLTNLAAIAIVVHLIPYLRIHGYDASFAALVTGLIGAMKLPGRLAFAPLERRFPSRVVSAMLFSLQAIGLVILVLIPTATGVFVFVALFGTAYGATTLARPALLAECYGSAQYGSISGILALFLAGARAVAPVGVGALYVGFGSYEPVVWILAAISVAAAGAVLLAETSRRRVEDRG
jgi:MFS family permease